MPRRYPRQIVVMCKSDLADFVTDQASHAEESNAEITRRMLGTAKRVWEASERTGWSVEDILGQVEKLPSAQA